MLLVCSYVYCKAYEEYYFAKHYRVNRRKKENKMIGEEKLCRRIIDTPKTGVSQVPFIIGRTIWTTGVSELPE